MSVEALAALLARRLDEAGRAGDPSVSVAELHRTLLPYHICRGSVGYATKAEYDLEMLELLSSDRYLVATESELSSAVSDEVASPEPGLGFLKNFAAAQLEIQSRLSSGSASAPALVVETTEPEAPADGEAVAVDRPGAEAVGALEEDLREHAACWQCSRQLPPRPDLRFCVYCGADQDRPCCPACGEEMAAGWAYCPRCGKGVSAASTSGR